jgi:glycosyltransferase involved in cell wall biosynthesis
VNILIVHQNYPAQFKHLGPALVRQGHVVKALQLHPDPLEPLEGVARVAYQPKRGSTPGVHPWVGDLETKTIRAEAALYAALQLRDGGFSPEVILAHPGWGESLFLKEVWPKARLGIYCEFYYAAQGTDIGFDPEFSAPSPTEPCRILLKNLNNDLHFRIADAGIAPTHWQASTFPPPFRDRITVIHDGIDTDLFRPNPQASLTLNRATGEAVTLGPGSEVLTFVNRNLEPYRGYHTFMRALPDLLRARANLQVLIVGGDGVSYGTPPTEGKSWKDVFIQAVRPQISDEDWTRVHFLGHVSHATLTGILQRSTVHVYLTYPFVLSWSLLEAMSIGCCVVASNTAPLLEAIQDGETGRLVDFFSPGALSACILELLEDPAQRARLSESARRFAVEHYDLQTRCLPRQLDWVQSLRV